jgi:hypothetical protein
MSRRKLARVITDTFYVACLLAASAVIVLLMAGCMTGTAGTGYGGQMMKTAGDLNAACAVQNGEAKRGLSHLNDGEVKVGLCQHARGVAMLRSLENMNLHPDMTQCQALLGHYKTEFVRRWPDEAPTSVSNLC